MRAATVYDQRYITDEQHEGIRDWTCPRLLYRRTGENDEFVV